MERVKILEYARALHDSHGNKAEAEAAQRAVKHEQAGETEHAADWRAVQAAIHEMRGPHAS